MYGLTVEFSGCKVGIEVPLLIVTSHNRSGDNEKAIVVEMGPKSLPGFLWSVESPGSIQCSAHSPITQKPQPMYTQHVPSLCDYM